jgi:hypothetical protein
VSCDSLALGSSVISNLVDFALLWRKTLVHPQIALRDVIWLRNLVLCGNFPAPGGEKDCHRLAKLERLLVLL